MRSVDENTNEAFELKNYMYNYCRSELFDVMSSTTDLGILMSTRGVNDKSSTLLEDSAKDPTQHHSSLTGLVCYTDSTQHV